MRFLPDWLDPIADMRGPYFLENRGREIFLDARQEIAAFASLSDDGTSSSDSDGVSSAGSGAYMVVWEPNQDGAKEVKIIPTMG